ncbi:MAG TPA: cytochrome c [Nitrospira sp.]|nr:cytochrome c [Nitrospira sp.]
MQENRRSRTREHRLQFAGLYGFLALSGLAASSLFAQDYPADLARGKTVYTLHCVKCHGAGGWGDGPVADSLKVAPANFHRFRSFLKSDEELLRTIEHGVVFSPMHSWRGQLTDAEMQDVLAYVRLLSQQGQ